MIIILHGSSAAGKTVAGEYLKSKGIQELVSHTTRAKRPGEINGEAYYFVDLATFKEIPKIEESVYAGHHYGVSRQEVWDKYQKAWVFAVTDRNGVKSFLKIFKDDVVVIKIESSLRRMRQRLEERGESKESIRMRMKINLNYKRTKDGFLSNYTIDNNTSIKTFYKNLDYILIKVKNSKIKKKIKSHFFYNERRHRKFFSNSIKV